ncbi:MAG: hypothetical protein U1E39_09465 [Planctomycetota bacterium]
MAADLDDGEGWDAERSPARVARASAAIAKRAAEQGHADAAEGRLPEAEEAEYRPFAREYAAAYFAMLEARRPFDLGVVLERRRWMSKYLPRLAALN